MVSILAGFNLDQYGLSGGGGLGTQTIRTSWSGYTACWVESGHSAICCHS